VIRPDKLDQSVSRMSLCPFEGAGRRRWLGQKSRGSDTVALQGHAGNNLLLTVVLCR